MNPKLMEVELNSLIFIMEKFRLLLCMKLVHIMEL